MKKHKNNLDFFCEDLITIGMLSTKQNIDFWLKSRAKDDYRVKRFHGSRTCICNAQKLVVPNKIAWLTLK